MIHESILIRGATVVSGEATRPQQDVLVKAGKIVEIGERLQSSADLVLDARGLHLIPGVLDPQVHFREPGQTWKEDLASGSRAAAAGGVTGFFDMPNNQPSVTTRDTMAAKKALAAEKCVVNYNFFIGATRENLEELNRVENVAGIKIFMGSSTGDLLVSDPRDLETIFANGNRLIAVHAENDEIINLKRQVFADSTDFADHMRVRPPEAALSATSLAVTLAKRYSRRLHILHLTTADEVAFLRKEKSKGPISVEVCPQHFLLHAPEVYERLGSLAQMNPPLRDKAHGDALWAGLRDGVIDCIATDHAPHTLDEKDQPFGSAPSGMPGVETSLPLMLNRVNDGYCSLNDVVRWMCENPVELYGATNKGYIKPGYDADLVLIDMAAQRMVTNGSLHTRVNWSPYNGWRLKGWPVFTFVGGQIVYREGQIIEGLRGSEIRIDDMRNARPSLLNSA